LVMDSEISGLENRHAFLKLGNNVARFHFEYMDVAQTTPGFVPRKVEDDELPFDPKTLVPKVSTPVAPGIDLEAATPTPPQPSTSPVSATDDENDAEPDEPTEEEIAASGANPDSPDDDQEEDVPVADDETIRV